MSVKQTSQPIKKPMASRYIHIFYHQLQNVDRSHIVIQIQSHLDWN